MQSGCRVETPIASGLYERDGDRPFFCANTQNGVVAFSAELCFFCVRSQEHLACLLIGYFVAGRKDLLAVRSQNTGELRSIVRFQGIDKCNDRILRSRKCRLSRGRLLLRASKDNPQGHDQAEWSINESHVRSLHHRRPPPPALRWPRELAERAELLFWYPESPLELVPVRAEGEQTGCCTARAWVAERRNDFE